MPTAMIGLDTVWSEIFNFFSDYAELLPLLKNSIIACVVLGVIGGMIGVPPR